MRLFRPGFPAACLYPEAIFRVKTTENVLYLTFDDGPDPFSTPQLLGILAMHNIKVLFFCNGNAAEHYPGLMNDIRKEGHMIGNHGYDHLNGWRTDCEKYLNDIFRASSFTSDKIFRPPFGRLSYKQKMVVSETYKLIFWDLMVYDFDRTFGRENSLRILKEKIRPGSIIVLHDTISSCANTIIQEFLCYAAEKDYRFGLIENET
jgi:peptidoglycan-N-acetylglucosamine deacetylase